MLFQQSRIIPTSACCEVMVRLPVDDPFWKYGYWLFVGQPCHKIIHHHQGIRIASYPKYDGYQSELTSMVYKLFDKKSEQTGTGISGNQRLANKLHEPIIRKFKKCKVYPSHWDKIWEAYFAGMLLSRYKRELHSCWMFLIFTGNTPGFFRWKSKKLLQSLMHFKKMSDESGCKPNKI